jgi:hypothetical protein
VAGAEYYELSYSTGSDPNGGTFIRDIPDNVCEVTTGLAAGTSYNLWVRAINDSGSSAWSASVYPQNPGTGFDPRVYGAYFSGLTRYLDGYQIGAVSTMTTEFPFNKVKFPDEPAGFPAIFRFGHPDVDVRKELDSGYQIQEDDQYLFYNALGWFNFSFLGITRMIFDEPNSNLSEFGNRTGFVVVEWLKGCGQGDGSGGGSSARYFIVKFTINEIPGEANTVFRGVNLSAFSSLGLSTLKASVLQDGDAYVAIACMRPDEFHPSYLPQGVLNNLAPGATTDEECWPAVTW